MSILIVGYDCIRWILDSYVLIQLIADHINYNKDVYIDHIEGDFSKYVEKKLGRMESGLNSQIICVLKHDWCLNWELVRYQRFLNKAFTNSILNWEENKCSLLLMVTNVLFYYNNKCKYLTTKMISKEVLFNYKK